MSDGTKIEWTDATVNAVNGCSVLSPGCKLCYAMKQAHRFDARRGLTRMTAGGMVWTGEVRFNETQLLKPLAWKRARRIFWNAHGDLFHESVPDAWIDKVFAVCALTPQHSHQILTKRSARMRAYMAAFEDRPEAFGEALAYVARAAELPKQAGLDAIDAMSFPLPRVWLGVSVEDQQRADERIPDLLATPAAVRFISAEPLLGPVDLRGYVRYGAGQGRRSWATWKWPEWVPQGTREAIESFWRADYGRGPDAWIRGAINNGQPPLGTFGSFTLCQSGSPLTEGRFVPCWNNIGIAVDGDGTPRTVSAGRYQGRPPYIDWVIVGGESGPGARPMHPGWARSLRDQCAAAGVPMLFKQWGEWAPGGDHLGEDRDGFLRLRSGDRAHVFPDHQQMGRVGKKAAGRLLDGVQHDGMPA